MLSGSELCLPYDAGGGSPVPPDAQPFASAASTLMGMHFGGGRFQTEPEGIPETARAPDRGASGAESSAWGFTGPRPDTAGFSATHPRPNT